VDPSPLTKGSVLGLYKPGRLRGTRIVGKVYNLYRVFKTDISAMLTVRSGLDPHMIIELEE